MKTKAAFLSLFIFLLADVSASQWTTTAGPEGGRASALFTTPRCVLLGLEGGNIYRSTDHGTTWTLSTSGLSNVPGDINAFALTGTSVFTSTGDSGVFRSTDDGVHWAHAGGNLPGYGWVYAVPGTAEDNLFAVTSAGVYRSTDDGASWEQSSVGLPADTTFNVLQVLDGLLLVGSDMGAGIFVSADTGSTWARSSAGLSGDGLKVLCLSAGGGSVVAGTRGGAYWSTDNGAHWTLCANELAATTVSRLYAGSGDFYAGTYGSGVFRSTDGGVHWTDASANLDNRNIRALIAVGTDLLAGTYGSGVVYRSTNSGAEWTGVGRGITGEGIYSLVARGGKVVVSTYDRLVASTDQGSTWSSADSGLASSAVYSLVLRPDGILAATSSWGIYRSTDEGLSWSPINTGLNGNARTVWAIAAGETNLYAATSSGVFRSTNEGAQWVQATNGIPDSLVRTVFALGGAVFAGTSTRVYRSTDNGQNWGVATTGLPQYYTPRTLAGDDSSVYLATATEVYRSTDDGDLWTPVTSGLPDSRDIRTLLRVSRAGSASPALLAGLNSGGVYVSQDRGSHWTDASAGLSGTGLGVSSLAADSATLYAGTLAGSVWRRSLPEVVVAVNADAALPRGYLLAQNYPNPFNPSTTIRYQLPMSSHVVLKVYNALGQEIATLVDAIQQPGIRSAVWHAEKVASGVYFCRLQAGSFESVKGMLVLK